LVRKAKRINIECIVRGYIAGSGFKEYENFGTICGIKLPMGLKDFSKLVEPIFTPSTKAEIGNHDINISEKETIKIIGEKTFNFLKEKSIALYKKASECALEKGIIIADTKFEFGFIGDEIILIDEILTPDSSRFWDLKNYQAGKEQNSFDKQIIRDYLEKDLKWNKTLPIPELSKEIVKKTISQYEKICNLLING
ncbi:MAG: phosphoribosylaminoimidazolesuccinocarboxamide synthase, partial [Elusimicrobiota bacterium]|nr:phosphoribosylaminoimidazolesuccinocarboxamide synthase [Elusimicrobiota bacterium]